MHGGNLEDAVKATVAHRPRPGCRHPGDHPSLTHDMTGPGNDWSEQGGSVARRAGEKSEPWQGGLRALYTERERERRIAHDLQHEPVNSQREAGKRRFDRNCC